MVLIVTRCRAFDRMYPYIILHTFEYAGHGFYFVTRTNIERIQGFERRDTDSFL